MVSEIGMILLKGYQETPLLNNSLFIAFETLKDFLLLENCYKKTYREQAAWIKMSNTECLRMSQGWKHMLIIPVLIRMRQQGHEFNSTLGFSIEGSRGISWTSSKLNRFKKCETGWGEVLWAVVLKMWCVFCNHKLTVLWLPA